MEKDEELFDIIYKKLADKGYTRKWQSELLCKAMEPLFQSGVVDKVAVDAKEHKDRVAALILIDFLKKCNLTNTIDMLRIESTLPESLFSRSIDWPNKEENILVKMVDLAKEDLMAEPAEKREQGSSVDTLRNSSTTSLDYDTAMSHMTLQDTGVVEEDSTTETLAGGDRTCLPSSEI